MKDQLSQNADPLAQLFPPALASYAKLLDDLIEILPFCLYNDGDTPSEAEEAKQLVQEERTRAVRAYIAHLKAANAARHG